jgi:hypothetical protein
VVAAMLWWPAIFIPQSAQGGKGKLNESLSVNAFAIHLGEFRRFIRIISML